MIALDKQLFNIFNNIGFKMFVINIALSYKVPSRTTIGYAAVNHVYKKMREDLLKFSLDESYKFSIEFFVFLYLVLFLSFELINSFIYIFIISYDKNSYYFPKITTYWVFTPY